MRSSKYRIHTAVIFLVVALNTMAQQGSNWVDGELYTYISNGAWCWFQDERAVIDTAKNKLIVASTNTGNSNDVALVNLDTKQVESTKRTRNMIKWADDHNSP
ncbi:MAG: hypothetical protein JW863_22595, partial [Chitinispirillaceae bacterium]|nr:hypothetical protein [Chitinispirillaceae bacterium]